MQLQGSAAPPRRHSEPSLPAARREREIERRSLIHVTLTPDPPTVAVHDALHEGQSDAAALELVTPVQALKHSEQLARVAHVEARTIVLHVVDDLAAGAPRADLDAGVRTMASELEG